MTTTLSGLIYFLQNLRVRNEALDKEEDWASYNPNKCWEDEKEEITWEKKQKYKRRR
jgi:hypothetical protein